VNPTCNQTLYDEGNGKFRGALECNGDRHLTVLEAAQ
jgi:hypothetical protein